MKRSSIPFVTFDAEELKKCPNAHVDELIFCPHCGQEHLLKASTGGTLLYYRCGERLYLGAVDGKRVTALFPRQEGQ